jgi:hypothetical protein
MSVDFWLGVAWGAGGLVAISALIMLLLIWVAPVIDAPDEHEGRGV